MKQDTPITKEQRHEVYKKILKFYETKGSLFNSVNYPEHPQGWFETNGFCAALSKLFWKKKDEIYDDIKNYPELVENRKVDYFRYFWDKYEEGYLQRVTLLLEAIEKTK